MLNLCQIMTLFYQILAIKENTDNHSIVKIYITVTLENNEINISKWSFTICRVYHMIMQAVYHKVIKKLHLSLSLTVVLLCVLSLVFFFFLTVL